MRLLFALPGFHRHDRGAEVALLSVADALAAMGNEVTVMGSGQPRAHKGYRFVHVPCIDRTRLERMPRIPPFRSETAWEDASFASALLWRYRPADFDFVLTCSFPFTHWCLRRPARHRPLQIFVTQNGDWPAVSNDAEFSSFNCDGLVCTNPDYFHRNVDHWECALIPNGIDLSRFRPGGEERMRLSLPADRPIVLMVSALIESKRVLDGIRAVARLDDAILVVAGDGPLRDEAKLLAEQILPNRFLRASFLPEDMPALYRSADAFLHLSLLESFGNVFLEAWACGLPIVAHESERLRWILGDQAMYLCDTENQQDLVNSLAMAIADKSKTFRLSGIERFAWPEVAKQYHCFFEGLLTAREHKQESPSRKGSA